MKIKKILLPLTTLLLLASCSATESPDLEPETGSELSDIEKVQYSVGGVLENKLADFDKYENTDSHIKVKNANEFLDAIHSTKNTYTTVLNKDGTLTQTINEASNVHIIEIENDLDLGYELIKNYATEKNYTFVDDEDSKDKDFETINVFTYDPLVEKGISHISISKAKDLLIYSKNGSKITHTCFKLESCNNVAIRNLSFDEIWQWEDSRSDAPSFTIGDYDVWDWAYFKIDFCDNIWIDHCKFGKSYDGQIDIANPTYNTSSTYSRAPLNGSGYENVHISFCNFGAGSDDQNGYIYKMMSNIEADYQLWKTNPTGYQETNDTCRYYRTLREIGASFEDILYGVAIPQKKGFLLGDTGNSSSGEQFFTTDTTFQANKKYYKVSGYEPSNGRAKCSSVPLTEGTDYQVGDVIANRKYTVHNSYLDQDVEISDYFEKTTVGSDYYNNLNLKASFNSCKFTNIEDRLPNIRGGITYMYNCIVDSSQYRSYENTSSLQTCKANVGTKVSAGGDIKTTNGKYKLALVSQGIIACIGGSVYSDTVIYRGLKDLAKNNNVLFSGENANLDNSGYKFVNVIYNIDSTLYKGSTEASSNPFSSVCKTDRLSPDYFSFHNDNNELPFTITRAREKITKLTDLDSYFTECPAGTNEKLNYLKVRY